MKSPIEVRMSRFDGGRVLEKDAVPTPAQSTSLYNTGGFWSLCTGEVISDVVQGGSPLINWIPSRGVDTLESRVAHLSWVGPANFDGSQTYAAYLADLDDQEECGYGPQADWSAFEYAHTGGDVSTSSPTLKPTNWGGRYVDNQPILRVRGAQAGESLQNDAQWALAQAGILLENHLNWNVVYGNEATYKYSYQGIDQIIRPGWVASRVIGPNPSTWSDPLYVNGSSLSTPEAILQTIKGMVRHIKLRAQQRGGRLTSNDMAIVMSLPHWTYLADAISLGLLMAVAPSNLTVNITPEGFFRERERITSGYYGFGFIPVDGEAIPVIVEDLLGTNVTLAGDTPGVIGDIYVLTRTFRGMNILEHQYRNWNAYQGYPTNGTERIVQNGMIRQGWVTEANKCFYYYTEMSGRLVSSFQPLQGRITDVTVETLMANENESGSFASRDWYAHWPAQNGNGVALISGVNA